MNKVSDTATSMRPASIARVGMQEIRLPLVQRQGPPSATLFMTRVAEILLKHSASSGWFSRKMVPL
jgi:hypothetical protein